MLFRSRVGRAAIYLFAVVLGLVSVRLATYNLFTKQELKKINLRKREGGYFTVNRLHRGGIASYEPSREAMLFYGDSAAEYISPNDPKDQQKTISQFLEIAAKDKPYIVYPAYRNGAGPEVFKSHFRYATARFPKFHYAVFPINLEWLSPMRRQNDYHHNYRRRVWEYAGASFPWLPVHIDLIFEAPEHGYKYKRERAETALGIVEWGKISPLKDLAEEHVASDPHRHVKSKEGKLYWDSAFQIAFAHDMDEKDPFVKILDAIQDNCNAKDVKCLFYLTPTNVKYLERNPHLSPILELLRKNVKFLENHARKRGMALLNLLDDAEIYQFGHFCSPHVTWPVRKYIAHCVAEAIEAIPGEAACPETRRSLFPY